MTPASGVAALLNFCVLDRFFPTIGAFNDVGYPQGSGEKNFFFSSADVPGPRAKERINKL